MYILVSKYSMFCFGIELDNQKRTTGHADKTYGLPPNQKPTDKDSNN